MKNESQGRGYRTITYAACAMVLGIGFCGFFPRFGNDWDSVLTLQLIGVGLLVSGAFLMIFGMVQLLSGGRE